eukprot:1450386-Amphidinium_carterae.1
MDPPLQWSLCMDALHRPAANAKLLQRRHFVCLETCHKWVYAVQSMDHGLIVAQSPQLAHLKVERKML